MTDFCNYSLCSHSVELFRLKLISSPRDILNSLCVCLAGEGTLVTQVLVYGTLEIVAIIS